MRRRIAGMAALLMVGLAACVTPPLGEPGKTAGIAELGSETVDGWTYDYFINRDYPCSIEGYQTFVIATRIGSSATATRPLWVYMHGGGVGYFDQNGEPQPGDKHLRQESASDLRDRLEGGNLLEGIRDEAAGFRLLAVSMCNRDIYGGPDRADPNNERETDDGRRRTVNGLFATKAAIAYTHERYPTDDYFLHGTSAGSVGTFHVAWGLQQQGLAPTGSVSDSGVLNEAFERVRPCNPRPEFARQAIAARLHPDIGEPENSPDRLVARGELTVPIMQVWSSGDFPPCGLTTMACPLPGGSVVTMGSTDCLNEPLRAAIAEQGPAGRSRSMRLCVEGADPRPCDAHVPTVKVQVNTDPAFRPDFWEDILDWVGERRADD